MEVVLWGTIWIRLSSGDPSSSRINALKFFVFTLNGFKETAKAALWTPGTWYLGQLRCPETGKAAGLALRGQGGEPLHALENQHTGGWREVRFLDCCMS